MRIATSTIYEQQTTAIDTLTTQEALYGQQLSTGKQLNAPSDDPQQIAQDLAVRTDIGVTTQVGQNLSNVSSQLTTVDGALGNLTSVVQSARSLAIQAASDTNTPTQLQEIAIQVGQLLQEAIGLGNTQYAGSYVFAGTAAPSSLPVVASGNPNTVVSFSGNNVAQQQKLPNGQAITSSVTLQQAFNYNAADGSASVFQVLQNLYDTLNKNQIVDASATAVNVAGEAIVPGAAAPPGTPLSALSTGAVPQIMATPLVPDSAGNYSIAISSGSAPNGVTVTFLPTDTVTNMVTKINAQTAATGVTATFNFATQKLSLSGTGAFQVADVSSPGANTTSNVLAAFNLQPQADVVGNISRQLGDVDHVTQVLLNARASVGSTIQQVGALQSVSSTQVNNDTTVQSGIEDTNIAKATTQFSLAQTALQAAYSTTSKLEQKDLFDFIT